MLFFAPHIQVVGARDLLQHSRRRLHHIGLIRLNMNRIPYVIQLVGARDLLQHSRRRLHHIGLIRLKMNRILSVILRSAYSTCRNREPTATFPALTTPAGTAGATGSTGSVRRPMVGRAPSGARPCASGLKYRRGGLMGSIISEGGLVRAGRRRYRGEGLGGSIPEGGLVRVGRRGSWRGRRRGGGGRRQSRRRRCRSIPCLTSEGT